MRFAVIILMAVAWIICIITGILMWLLTITEPEIHGFAGAIACILTIVHMIQQCKGFIGLLKKRNKVQEE